MIVLATCPTCKAEFEFHDRAYLGGGRDEQRCPNGHIYQESRPSSLEPPLLNIIRESLAKPYAIVEALEHTLAMYVTRVPTDKAAQAGSHRIHRLSVKDALTFLLNLKSPTWRDVATDPPKFEQRVLFAWNDDRAVTSGMRIDDPLGKFMFDDLMFRQKDAPPVWWMDLPPIPGRR